MSAISRRGKTKLILLKERATDPGGVADTLSLYAKDVSGTSLLFFQDSAGGIVQLGAAREILPEVWTQNDVAASQSGVDLSAQSSQLFDTFKAIRPGSVVAISTRFSSTITAGTCTITLIKNGTPGTAAVVHTNASNQNGGIFTQLTGVDTFVAGDLLGLEITTDGGFLPITTDVEAVIEVIV